LRKKFDFTVEHIVAHAEELLENLNERMTGSLRPIF